MNKKMAAAVLAAAVAFGACKAVWAVESNQKTVSEASNQKVVSETMYSAGGIVYQAGPARIFGEDISFLESKIRSVSVITFNPQNYSGAAQTTEPITIMETEILGDEDVKQLKEDSTVLEFIDENVIQEQDSDLGNDTDNIESETNKSDPETKEEFVVDSVSANSVISVSGNSISENSLLEDA